MEKPLKSLLAVLCLAAWLGACSTAPMQTSATTGVQQVDAVERLGTQWGDEVRSRVSNVDLRRTTATPIAETAIHYADKLYQGRRITTIALVAGKIELSVHSDRQALPLVRDGNRYYLQGRAGSAYQLVYRNQSGNTYEIVASVDGLDVISGQPASRESGGYVLQPHDTLTIEGFRKSDDAVASFIFTKPHDAYAAHTPAGDVRNTGIIGTAVYELYDPNAQPTHSCVCHGYPAGISGRRLRAAAALAASCPQKKPDCRPAFFVALAPQLRMTPLRQLVSTALP